jgi:hypothetical protein
VGKLIVAWHIVVPTDFSGAGPRLMRLFWAILILLVLFAIDRAYMQELNDLVPQRGAMFAVARGCRNCIVAGVAKVGSQMPPL